MATREELFRMQKTHQKLAVRSEEMGRHKQAQAHVREFTRLKNEIAQTDRSKNDKVNP